VTDLERFFSQLVRNLAAADRDRLRQPLTVAEIRESIVPYRANRRALKLESSEDYELVVMRLCAGEGGFASVGPEEVRAEFVKEVGSPNPDLTLVERHQKAGVHLDPKAVARALDPNPGLAYAPKERASPAERQGLAASPEKTERKPRPEVLQPGQAGAKVLRCNRCGGGLPTGRPVNFCPHCGQNLTRRRCPQCQTELESEWRHCVNCGLSLTGR
jgi:predicted RNA-binding Zn-ribbon protein involved in translation (DUF1610 family)